jgi:cytochrome bd-type quinol oxidase subunit 1
MTLDPVLLSRLQFFWVISFHILLPAFTVGLACYIAVLESLYLKTGDHTYFRVSVFWTKILEWFPALSCRFSLAPIGAVSRMRPPMLSAR